MTAGVTTCLHVEYYAAAEAFRVTWPDGRVIFVVECRVTCTRCGGAWYTDDRSMAVVPADAAHVSVT